MMKKVVVTISLLLPMTALCAETPLSVPSDRKAKYWVLQKSGPRSGRVILTKRVGPSGESFAKRVYNCDNFTWKYIGDGDTLADLAKSKPSPKMSEVLPNSIAESVGREACKEK
jgi:hypothetical protein